MIRQPKRAAPLLPFAALALVPTAASAQGDGPASLDAIINEDSAQAWVICALVSAYMQQGVVDEAESALRDEEQKMLVAVAVGRFIEQRGLTLDAAKAEAVAVLTARAPLYEDGSGTELGDTGKCILSGMVSQSGDEQSERLVAAYEALEPF